jgi:hypothetical protein
MLRHHGNFDARQGLAQKAAIGLAIEIDIARNSA